MAGEKGRYSNWHMRIGIASATAACLWVAGAQADPIVPDPDWKIGGAWYQQFHLLTSLQTGFNYYDELVAAELTNKSFTASNPAAARYLSQTGQLLSQTAFTVSLQPVYQINDRAFLFANITAGMVDELAGGNPNATRAGGWQVQTLPGTTNYGGGIGDIFLGGQYRFVDETDTMPSLTAGLTGIIPAAQYTSLGNGRAGGIVELDARKYVTSDVFVTGGLAYGMLSGKGTVANTSIESVNFGVGALLNQGQEVPSLNVSYTHIGATAVGNGLSLNSQDSLGLEFNVKLPWKGLSTFLGFSNLQQFSISRTTVAFGLRYALF
jgi:hypothetical protein